LSAVIEQTFPETLTLGLIPSASYQGLPCQSRVLPIRNVHTFIGHFRYEWNFTIGTIHGGMRQTEPGAEPQHYEFLAADRSDSRREFVAALCDVSRERGSIVVYNAAFESQRLSELAAWLLSSRSESGTFRLAFGICFH
jgi:hypothetical protein